jgi:hypothetical protein
VLSRLGQFPNLRQLALAVQRESLAKKAAVIFDVNPIVVRIRQKEGRLPK